MLKYVVFGTILALPIYQSMINQKIRWNAKDYDYLNKQVRKWEAIIKEKECDDVRNQHNRVIREQVVLSQDKSFIREYL